MKVTSGSNLQRVRAHIRALQQSSRAIDSREIDALFGIRSRERRLDAMDLVMKYGNEMMEWYDHTPYEVIRELFRRLAPRRGDVFYDLGCGYGRVVLWGALATHASFHGIELVAERLNVAERAHQRLGLRNLQLHHSNVISAEFQDGNLFFLFDPFFSGTLRRVAKKLARIARHHPIRIASFWGTGPFFGGCKWLSESPRPAGRADDPYALRTFASI